MVLRPIDLHQIDTLPNCQIEHILRAIVKMPHQQIAKSSTSSNFQIEPIASQ